MERRNIYISTTLPYANSKAHVGHLLEMLQADFLTRYFRMYKRKVYFNTGLDEHGSKIYETAISLDKTPEEHTNCQSKIWKEFHKSFNIEYDNFYRTSDDSHKVKVLEFWNKVDKYIYQKNYKGKYCKGCEEFKKDSDLIDDKCKLHPNLTLDIVNELNYFLKLTELDKDLLEHVENNFIYPKRKKNELINNIKDVQDLSISRNINKVPWAIDVPNDNSQTIYVWFDALVNYINAIGDKKWDDCITIQLCGPDNLRFQGHIWQSMLNAYGSKFTDKLLVHGTILDDKGVKMSKSIGNVVDPIDQLERYGLDAIRNYTLSLSTFGNSNWNEQDLIELYNSRLVNDYGNLISRVLHLVDKFDINTDNKDLEFCINLDTDIAEIYNKFGESLNISDYCIDVNKISKFANKYTNDNVPWEQKDGYEIVISNLYYLLYRLTELYKPIIPNRYEEIIDSIKNKEKVKLFKKL